MRKKLSSKALLCSFFFFILFAFTQIISLYSRKIADINAIELLMCIRFTTFPSFKKKSTALFL